MNNAPNRGLENSLGIEAAFPWQWSWRRLFQIDGLNDYHCSKEDQLRLTALPPQTMLRADRGYDAN
jgi:hypothetical protein